MSRHVANKMNVASCAAVLSLLMVGSSFAQGVDPAAPATAEGFEPVRAGAENAQPDAAAPDASTAEAVTEAAGETPEADTAGQIDEIVITARRREERLQDVPVAVTALSEEALYKSGITSTMDLQMKTPGLTIGNQGGGFIPFIRGIGSANASAGQENAVPIYIDGIYQASPYIAVTALTSIQRVEVLKGPQGTLFGRNATGGLINIVTKDPSHTSASDFRVGYGSFDTFTASAYTTTGLSETLASDLSVYYSDQRNGWGENIETGNDSKNGSEFIIRSKSQWDATESTRLKLTLDYSRSHDNRGWSYAVLPGSTAIGGFGALPDYYDSNLSFDPRMQNESVGVALNARQSFENFDLVSISAYRDSTTTYVFDNDITPLFVSHARAQDQVEKTLTQEIQFVSNWDSPFSLIFGAFYFYDKAGYGNPHGLRLVGESVVTPDVASGVDLVGLIKTNSYSVFTEGSYAFNERTKLTVGARFTHDKRELSGRTDLTDEDGGVVLSIPTDGRKADYEEPTYRVTLDHKVTDVVLAYATVSRGFKGGNFNTINAANPAYKPETLDAYELGIKSDLFDKRLRLNAAAFYYDYKNLQLVQQGTSTQFVINVPSTSKLAGLELEGTWQIADELSLNFGGNMLDTEYGSFPNAPCEVPAPGGGNTVDADGCDATGNQLLRAPDLTYFIGADYGIDSSLGRFDFSAVFNHSAAFPFKPDGRLRQSAYDVVNASVIWSLNDSPYSFALIGKNVLNEEYALFMEESTSGDFYAPAAPRTIMAEVRARF